MTWSAFAACQSIQRSATKTRPRAASICSCSQIRMTVHPAARKHSFVSASRSLLALIFAAHHS